MYKIGDKVVYPNHGAGTIVGIETKTILDEKKEYYIMKLPIGEMKVMIPVDKIDKIGIRDVISEQKADEVFELLNGEKSKMSQNWNRRFRANQEKLKTGDIFEVAEVVRNLSIRDREKGLSTGEKKMLSNARQILISELVLAKDMDEESISEKMDDLFTLTEKEEQEKKEKEEKAKKAKKAKKEKKEKAEKEKEEKEEKEKKDSDS
ncbi:CarD family transcriptional regulator [Halanaerobium saccharolyticum]|uniref:CarD family transcriptional regulator n=1 Tax=Halanaerobium saccharolyticum TaxID=43595 RepID=A0A4R6LKM3_9FIRM|nr:CarD family transcriptional regulator [Halanaerobium saccharolyticum]TDO84885.1 CarD family transcriptional regulator [Halanaerobium saccharolyticum]